MLLILLSTVLSTVRLPELNVWVGDPSRVYLECDGDWIGTDVENVQISHNNKVNITASTDIVMLSTINVGSKSFGHSRRGNYYYLSNTFAAINISDPTESTVLYKNSNKTLAVKSSGDFLFTVTVLPGEADDIIISIFNITTPANPLWLAETTHPNNIGFAIEAFISNGEHILCVAAPSSFDFYAYSSSSNQLNQIGSHISTARAEILLSYSNLLFAGYGTPDMAGSVLGFDIFSVEDPMHPMKIMTVGDDFYTTGFHIRGDVLFVLGFRKGFPRKFFIESYDTSNKNELTPLSRTYSCGGTQQKEYRNTLYVPCMNGKIAKYNITNSSNITLLGEEILNTPELKRLLLPINDKTDSNKPTMMISNSMTLEEGGSSIIGVCGILIEVSSSLKGNYSISLSATSNGNDIAASLPLVVKWKIPKSIISIPNVVVDVGGFFKFIIAKEFYSDPYDGVINMELENGSVIPEWLKTDPVGLNNPFKLTLKNSNYVSNPTALFIGRLSYPSSQMFLFVCNQSVIMSFAISLSSSLLPSEVYQSSRALPIKRSNIQRFVVQLSEEGYAVASDQEIAFCYGRCRYHLIPATITILIGTNSDTVYAITDKGLFSVHYDGRISEAIILNNNNNNSTILDCSLNDVLICIVSTDIGAELVVFDTIYMSVVAVIDIKKIVFNPKSIAVGSGGVIVVADEEKLSFLKISYSDSSVTLLETVNNVSYSSIVINPMMGLLYGITFNKEIEIISTLDGIQFSGYVKNDFNISVKIQNEHASFTDSISLLVKSEIPISPNSDSEKSTPNRRIILFLILIALICLIVFGVKKFINRRSNVTEENADIPLREISEQGDPSVSTDTAEQ